MSFLRGRLDQDRALSCAGLEGVKDGARVTVAGVVLVRQRPGSAKGVVFMTIEDETGIANAVIWPKTLERFRKVVMGARLVSITGRIQRHERIIHVVAQRLDDRSGWLSVLSEDEGTTIPLPIANADEVRRPEPGSARGAKDDARRRQGDAAPSEHPRLSRAHPRDVRIIPKSRDFH